MSKVGKDRKNRLTFNVFIHEHTIKVFKTALDVSVLIVASFWFYSVSLFSLWPEWWSTLHAQQQYYIIKWGTGNSCFRFSSLKADFKWILLRVIRSGWSRSRRRSPLCCIFILICVLFSGWFSRFNAGQLQMRPSYAVYKKTGIRLIKVLLKEWQCRRK